MYFQSLKSQLIVLIMPIFCISDAYIWSLADSGKTAPPESSQFLGILK